MHKLITTLVLSGVMVFSAVTASAQAEKKGKKGKKADAAQVNGTAPKSLIHVVTVSWKEGTTPEQIQAALDGAQKLPSQFPGITRVWTKTVKAQGGKSHVIAMEFAGEDALKQYAGSDAQKEWYKVYEGIRGSSTTFDVTN